MAKISEAPDIKSLCAHINNHMYTFPGSAANTYTTPHTDLYIYEEYIHMWQNHMKVYNSYRMYILKYTH